ncbi:MAG: class I SAM-dependent methyltransferase [Cyanobacteriota bacterium]
MNVKNEPVREFWEKAACGENLYLKGLEKDDYLEQAKVRYELEPFILDFAEFEKASGKKVLEIGVGLGADHQRWAEAGAMLYGVDLTQRAIDATRRRFELLDLKSHLQVADAENLPFEDEAFDWVYSWGVLHHSSNTAKAIAEVWRVLKPGGVAKLMIYHKYSFVGYMLWIRYALLRFKPLTSLHQIYENYLESPGTKAYSLEEARQLLSKFQSVEIQTILTHGDLLTSSAGQRHQGLMLSVARSLWPRWIIRTFFPNHGLFMLIKATK